MSLLSGRLHPMALLWKSCCFSLSCYFEGCERFFPKIYHGLKVLYFMLLL